jgi:O-antigen/teichoic acid export membrane protein
MTDPEIPIDQAALSASSKKAGLKRLGKALSVSVLNQGVSSATNFGVGLYLVRVLSPEEFGLWGIGFAICLFFGGVGNAMFLTQMVVLTPEKPESERPAFAARILALVSALCVAAAVVSAAGVAIGSAFFPGFSQYESMGYATIAASVGYLLKEFFVRHAYNARREVWALEVHLALAACLAAIFTVQWFAGTGFGVGTALAVYGGAHIAAAVLGLALARLPLGAIALPSCVADLRETWLGGRWASLSNVAYFLRSQAHTVIVAATLGPAGVGRMNAARLFVTPAVMLTPALSQVFLPRISESRVAGGDEFRRTGRFFTAILLGVAVIYSLALLAGYNFLSPLVVGYRYSDLGLLVAFWCLFTCVLALRSGQEVEILALKKFREYFFSNIVVAIVSIFIIWVSASLWYLEGAIIGLILNELLLTLYYKQILRRDRLSNSTSVSV